MLTDPYIIIKIVRNHFAVIDDKFYTSRSPEYVVPKQLCQYFIKRYCKKLNYRQIGDLFNLDHSTVIHSCKQIKNLMFKNKKFTQQVYKINSLILNSKSYLEYLKKERDRIEKEIQKIESENIEVDFELIKAS